jgi:hypothetical protein
VGTAHTGRAADTVLQGDRDNNTASCWMRLQEPRVTTAMACGGGGGVERLRRIRALESFEGDAEGKWHSDRATTGATSLTRGG